MIAVTQVKSQRYCGRTCDYWLTIRRPLEQLQNGLWLAEYPGGTSETFASMPEVR